MSSLRELPELLALLKECSVPTLQFAIQVILNEIVLRNEIRQENNSGMRTPG